MRDFCKGSECTRFLCVLIASDRYTRVGIKMEPCCICTEVAQQEVWVELMCGHRYHRPCLEAWNKSCPMCRGPYIIKSYYHYDTEEKSLTPTEQGFYQVSFHQGQVVKQDPWPESTTLAGMLSLFQQFSHTQWSLPLPG